MRVNGILRWALNAKLKQVRKNHSGNHGWDATYENLLSNADSVDEKHRFNETLKF